MVSPMSNETPKITPSETGRLRHVRLGVRLLGEISVQSASRATLDVDTSLAPPGNGVFSFNVDIEHSNPYVNLSYLAVSPRTSRPSANYQARSSKHVFHGTV